jgi:hypothetical protein
MELNKEKYILHRSGWGNVSMTDYLQAMRLPSAYGGELELISFQSITKRPVCVLVNNYRLGTYPGTIDFSSHNKNTAYFKLFEQHYEPLIMREDKKGVLETSTNTFVPSPTSILVSIYTNDDQSMGKDNEFVRLDGLSEDGPVDLELNVALRKIKSKRESKDKNELEIKEGEKRSRTDDSEIYSNQTFFSKKRKADDPKQSKITSFMSKRIGPPIEQKISSETPEFAVPVSKQNQPRMVSFLAKPSAQLIERAAESKIKGDKKIHPKVTHQFLRHGRAKVVEETKDRESDECELEGEGKDVSEGLSPHKVSDQFSSPKQTSHAQFERLQKREISHYTYLINSVLSVSSALDTMTGMLQTLYCNTYSATVILKAVEKVRQFWDSVLTAEETKEFRDSAYFFFNTRKNNALLRIEVQEGTNENSNNIDVEELYSDFIVNDFGSRMNATVVSEACVERVFSKIAHMISIHQLSVSDDVMLGMLNCSKEHK